MRCFLFPSIFLHSTFYLASRLFSLFLQNIQLFYFAPAVKFNTNARVIQFLTPTHVYVFVHKYVAFLHLSVCSPPVSSLAFNINNIFYFPQYSLFVAYTYVSRSSSHNTVLIFRDTRELVLSRPPIILQSLVSESPLCGKSMNGILWIVEVG